MWKIKNSSFFALLFCLQCFSLHVSLCGIRQGTAALLVLSLCVLIQSVLQEKRFQKCLNLLLLVITEAPDFIYLFSFFMILPV